ncbi:MAG: pilus assembly protein PilP [Gammaproteobacteria bacterium]
MLKLLNKVPRLNGKPVFMIVLCGLLAACSDSHDMNDLQQYIVEVSLRDGGPVEPMPQFLPYEAFTYSAASMRSPFDVPVMAGTNVAETPITQVRPDFDRTPQPLEVFALSNLNMVGMITRANAIIALVQDENGKIHRVGVGTYMGRNHGRVNTVTQSVIELIEIVPSGDGGWVERPRTLAIQN